MPNYNPNDTPGMPSNDQSGELQSETPRADTVPSPLQASIQNTGQQDMLSNFLGAEPYQPYSPAESQGYQPGWSPQALWTNQLITGKNALQQLSSTGAYLGKKMAEMQPSYDPNTGTWDYGAFTSGRGLFTPGEQQMGKELIKQWPYFIPAVGWYGMTYGRPALHGDWRRIAEEARVNPLGKALDMMPGLDLFTGEVEGAQGAARGVSAVGKKVAQNILRPINMGVSKLMELYPELAANRFLESGGLFKLTGEEAAKFRDMRQKLFEAYEKIDDNDKKLVSTALTGSDPNLDYLLKKPEIMRYAKLAGDLEEIRWQKLLERGIVTPEDWYVTRVAPKYFGELQRGTEQPPLRANGNKFHLDTLHSADAYNSNMQAAMRDYLKRKPFDASSAYNPISFNDVVNRHFQQPLGPTNKIPGLEESVTPPRVTGGITKQQIGGKSVQSPFLAGKHSLNAAKALVRKLELADRFLKIYDWLIDNLVVIEALPPAIRKAAAQKLENILRPLMGGAGLLREHMDVINEIARMATWPDDKPALLAQLKAIAEGKLPLIAGAFADVWNATAQMQRQLSVLSDVLFGTYIAAQSWLFFAFSSINGPERMRYALIAMALAKDERVASKLPIEFIPQRPSFDYKNPLLQHLSTWANSGYETADHIRAVDAVRTMLQEYDKLTGQTKAFVLRVFQTQETLSQQARKLFKTARAFGGGYPKDIYKTVQDMAKETAGMDDVAKAAHMEGWVKSYRRTPAGGRKLTGYRKRITLGLVGKTLADWDKFVSGITKMLDDVYGAYHRPVKQGYTTILNTLIWAKMMRHAMTLAAHAVKYAPYKLRAAVRVNQVLYKYQQNLPEQKALPQWARDAGLWRVNVPSAPGVAYVAYDNGWDLLLQAARTVQGVALFFPHAQTDDLESGYIDAQLNGWVNVGILSGGLTGGKSRLPYPPYRLVRNPYYSQYDPLAPRPYGAEEGVLNYDLLEMYNRRQTGQKLDFRKQIKVDPYPDFLQKLVVSVAEGFAPKLWSPAKHIANLAGNINISDVGIPGVPGREYPKIQLRQGKVEPAPRVWLGNLIPGGAKIGAPVAVRLNPEAERYEREAKNPPPFMRISRGRPSMTISAPPKKVLRDLTRFGKIVQTSPKLKRYISKP